MKEIMSRKELHRGRGRDLRRRLLELESGQVAGVKPLAAAKCRGIFNGRKC